ncbi:MAG: SCO family protein [Candidatus Binatia bacterium]
MFDGKDWRMLNNFKMWRLRPCHFSVCISILFVMPSLLFSAQSTPKSEGNFNPAGLSGPVYKGGMVTPPLPKPKFTLTDTASAPFDFWQKTSGRVALLFFGYTHCPDVCPLQMASIASGLKQLPANVVDQIEVVFVTTDPKRDTPAAVRKWLDHFDKRFVGLTGTDAEIEAAQHAAALPLARQAPLGDRDYQVAHASFVIAYTKDNLGHVIYPGGVTQEDWAQDLPRLVKETWPRH